MTNSSDKGNKPRITVVIPAYKVAKHILGLLNNIGPEVTRIIVVDDGCPEKSGNLVLKECADKRIKVLFHPENLGVGASVISGYREALREGCDVIIKLDGDGQMNPALIPRMILPVLDGQADYSKGNRFFNVTKVKSMPLGRIIGNLALSFFAKASSGYWNIFDPNNGYTAINSKVVGQLPLERISTRYFFESDMLFHLNLMRAVVIDVPMDAKYGDETSNLRLVDSVFEFAFKHMRNYFRRITYGYYLRDFTLASIELPLGSALCIFGFVVGLKSWIHSMNDGIPTQPGTLILIAMSFLSGLQLLLGFFAFDISNTPREPISKFLPNVAQNTL